MNRMRVNVVFRGEWSALAASLSVATCLSVAGCGGSPSTDSSSGDPGGSLGNTASSGSRRSASTTGGSGSTSSGSRSSATTSSATGGSTGGTTTTGMTTTGMTTTGSSRRSSTSSRSSISSSTSSTGGGSSTTFPVGWLYTSGNQIFSSNGTTGTQWMGRGVNMDDLYLCGYNDSLWMTNPDQTLETIVTGLMAWKPTFVRVSLAMNSHTAKTSWTSNPSQYSTPMTNVIRALGANAGVHVLVTLRSDASMVESDANDEATYLPQTATDATYTALVDSFANDGFVMFGLCNEPGTISGPDLVPLMSHAVATIRAEEDRLGVPHHVVSVSGDHWASDISFYSASPLPYDNLVYEIHGYPPAVDSYTYANIPVILGEYGSLTDPTSFYADVESKHISNLAWDFEPFVNCAPDLLNVTGAATSLTASTWGTTVFNYLTSH